MAADGPDLLTLQRWMSRVVQHPRDAAAGARSRQAHGLISAGRALRGDVVVPSATMRPAERLDVYGGGYFVRLCDALRVDFPGVVHAMGDHAFRHLVADYVLRHPSRHQNLIFLGFALPDFIATRRSLPHRAFLRDLARLELAMVQAFHAPAFTPLDVGALEHLSPAEWSRVVLHGNPSLHLLELGYPVNGYLQAVFDDGDPEIPPRRRTRVAVYRKEYKVWRHTLRREPFATLSAICTGTPLGESLQHAGGRAAHVGDWFQDWAADGLFSKAISE